MYFITTLTFRVNCVQPVFFFVEQPMKVFKLKTVNRSALPTRGTRSLTGDKVISDGKK
jgi:hypothetical protein